MIPASRMIKTYAFGLALLMGAVTAQSQNPQLFHLRNSKGLLEQTAALKDTQYHLLRFQTDYSPSAWAEFSHTNSPFRLSTGNGFELYTNNLYRMSVDSNGRFRFAGLPNDNTQTRVMVTDSLGYVFYRNLSSLNTLIFNNGLTNNNGTVQLGGALISNTTISNIDSSITFLFNNGSYKTIGFIGAYQGEMSKYADGRYQIFSEKSSAVNDYWNWNWSIDTLTKHITVGALEPDWGFKYDVMNFTTFNGYTPRPSFTRTAGNNYSRWGFSNTLGGMYIDTFRINGVEDRLFNFGLDGNITIYVSPATGANTDSVLVWNASSKVVKKVAQSSIISGSGLAWLQGGNTFGATGVLGTLDNQNLVFTANNQQSGLIDVVNFNTAFGQIALSANTSGVFNTAIGRGALGYSVSGSNNTAVGIYALVNNTSGSYNNAIGRQTLNFNTTGIFNTADGYQNLFSNNTGSNNASYGFQSLYSNTTGSNNTTSGYTTGFTNTTGSNNTFIGSNTGQGISTGNNNTILGANVTGLSPALNSNIIIADGQGNRRINVDSIGEVGIGTTTPSAQLHTTGTVRFAGLISDSSKTRVLVSDTAGNLYYRSLSSSFFNNSIPWLQGGNSFGTTGILGTLDNNHLDFYTNNTQNARLTNTGNFLIGTTTDNGAKFQLNGNAIQNSSYTFTFGNAIRFDNYNVPSASRIFSPGQIFYQSNNTGDQHYFANQLGTAFQGTLVTMDPGPYPALPDNQLTLKVLGRYGTVGLNINMLGYAGIGTFTPTAQLHTTGTVRFAGLTNDSAKNRILVSDSTGNLYYRNLSSLTGSGIGTVTSVATGYGLTGGTITNAGTISADTTALATPYFVKNNAWSLTGNANTNSGTNFLGTTDNHPLVFKVRGFRSAYIDSGGGGGAGNTYFGYVAGNNVSSGNTNSFFGFQAGSSITTQSGNTAIGYNALDDVTGFQNTVLGTGALASTLSHATSNNAIAIGYAAGQQYTVQDSSITIGAWNSFSNSVGTNSILIGAGVNYNLGCGSCFATNQTIIGHHILSPLSNVAILSRYDQHTIIGSALTGQTDNSSTLQVQGAVTIKKDSLSTSSANTVMSVGIDTTTGKLVKFTGNIGGGSSGTVTSVGTGYGLTGGTITSTGTLVADTTKLVAYTDTLKTGGIATQTYVLNHFATASNGLSFANNNITLGGTLTANTTINTTSNFGLTVTGGSLGTVFQSTNTSSGTAINANSTNGIAINAIGSSHGVLGVGSTVAGVAGISDGSFGGIYGQTSTGRAGVFNYIAPADSNSTLPVIELWRQITQGHIPTNGIGGSIDFKTSTSNYNLGISSRVVSKWTDVTDPTKTGQLEFWTTNSGVSTRKMAVAGNGNLILDTYPNTRNDGSTSSALYVDANGNLKYGPISGVGGNGTVTSVGTGYGLSGGTITSTGTLVADTTVLATKNYINGQGYLKTAVTNVATGYGLTGGAITSTGTLVADTTKLIPYTDTLKTGGIATQYYVSAHTGSTLQGLIPVLYYGDTTNQSIKASGGISSAPYATLNSGASLGWAYTSAATALPNKVTLSGTGNNTWGWAVPKFDTTTNKLVAVVIKVVERLSTNWNLVNQGTSSQTYVIQTTRKDSLTSSALASPLTSSTYATNQGPYTLSPGADTVGAGTVASPQYFYDYSNLVTIYDSITSLSGFAGFIGSSGNTIMGYIPKSTNAVISGSNGGLSTQFSDSMINYVTFYYNNGTSSSAYYGTIVLKDTASGIVTLKTAPKVSSSYTLNLPEGNNGDTLATKSYARSLIAAAGNGTVTNVGTGYGLTGGAITNTGTIVADTTKLIPYTDTSKAGGIATQSYVLSHSGSGTVTSVATGYGLTGGTITNSGTLVADTTKLVPYTDTSKINGMASKTFVTTQGYLKTAVTSVATGYGLTGGTITSTGTLVADTTKIVPYTDTAKVGGIATQTYVLSHAGSGTVTNVSTVNGYGITATVSNPTTTPAITISTDTTKLVPYTDTSKVNGIASKTFVTGQGYLKTAVTSVATGYGLTGGTITNAGTLLADTTKLVAYTDTSKVGGVATQTYVNSHNYWTLSGGNLSNNSGTNVGIGTTTPASKLEVAGSFAANFVTVSANYTVLATDYTIYVTNGATAVTITLPAASGDNRRIYNIARGTGSTGTITIATAGGNVEALAGTLGTTTTVAALGAYGSKITFQSNGTNYVRIGN
jgi:hypothetical protein